MKSPKWLMDINPRVNDASQRVPIEIHMHVKLDESKKAQNHTGKCSYIAHVSSCSPAATPSEARRCPSKLTGA